MIGKANSFISLTTMFLIKKSPKNIACNIAQYILSVSVLFLPKVRLYECCPLDKLLTQNFA